MRCLVTGATGFVGGHVAEHLRSQGHEVVTIARPTSDTHLCRQLGVEIVEGDITDPAVVEIACRDVEAVIHCAAKVGDWGPIEEYRRINVDALATLLEAARSKRLQRFIHISSLGVYEAKDHHQTDETVPIPEKHMDGYTQTKVEAERLALRIARETQIPLVVLRPGFVYGPRDRTILPRILGNLRAGLVRYFGSRSKKLNNTYVGNIVEAVQLALDHPKAVGQTYNITDARCVSKQEFFDTIADLAHLPRPAATLPMWLALLLCHAFEISGKFFGFEPLLTRAKVKFMGLNLDYSIEKIRRELGYEGKVTFEDGMRKTIAWLQRKEAMH